MSSRKHLPVSGLARLARNSLLVSWVTLCALGFVGCARSSSVVRLGPHRPSDEPAPTRVKHTPPAVKVEKLPLRRNNKCYYLDGFWSPKGDEWTWTRGEWIHPPPGCYYAPPTTQYEDLDVGTALVFRPGIWLPFARNSLQCESPKPCRDSNESDESPADSSDDTREPS